MLLPYITFRILGDKSRIDLTYDDKQEFVYRDRYRLSYNSFLNEFTLRLSPFLFWFCLPRQFSNMHLAKNSFEKGLASLLSRCDFRFAKRGRQDKID